MLYEIIKKREFSDKRYIVIRMLTDLGPTKLERMIREELDIESIKNLWSGVLDHGAILFKCCGKDVVILWNVGKVTKIVEIKEMDEFDVGEIEEDIASGGIMSSVIRIMREDY